MGLSTVKRYLPRSLYGRAALILLVPIVTLQLVVSFAFIQRLYEDVTVQMAGNIALELDLLLQAQSPRDQLRLADALELDLFEPGARIENNRYFYDLSGRALQRALHARYPNLTGVELVQDDKRVRLSLETDNGFLEVGFSRRRVSASNPHQLLVLMVLTGALMTLIAYQFLRNQLRPIRRLALAAEAFGKGRIEPYGPSGASEVRSAGAAFLAMRNRIERHIEQRTLMLSGVSHDLRTPLTRLKLGLSLQEETPEIEALIRDVDEMESLIDAFLTFARADAIEDARMTDLSDLVRVCVENWVRMHKDVTLVRLPDDLPEIEIRPAALLRALENLVGNAVRYGTRARVSVRSLDNAVCIRVEDNGPGIPPDKREQALKPFARLDQSRNQNKGSGVGLGLAIAADIVRSHGGSLRLGESQDLKGLQAEIILPK